MDDHKVKSTQATGRFAWAAGACVAAALVAIVLAAPHLTPSSRGTHQAGQASVLVDITRRGMLIADKTPIERVEGMQVGDQLRLRVVGAAPYVSLELCAQDNACQSVFDGSLPEDGWIPAGLAISRATPKRLRLRSGPSGDAVQHGEPMDFVLNVR